MANITFVDENDNVIGEGTKQDAWEKGIVHRIVRIFLFNSRGELLIQKRADHIASLPGKWDQSAAGHVDAGEDYAIAARRELSEEIGVKDVDLIEKGKLFTDERDETDKIKKRFNMLYTGTYDEKILPNAEEISETRWIHPKELSAWMNKQPNDFTAGFVKNFKYLQNLGN